MLPSFAFIAFNPLEEHNSRKELVHSSLYIKLNYKLIDIKTYRFFKYFIVSPFFEIFLRNRCPTECDFPTFRSLVAHGANATLYIKFFFSTEIYSLDAYATT